MKKVKRKIAWSILIAIISDFLFLNGFPCLSREGIARAAMQLHAGITLGENWFTHKGVDLFAKKGTTICSLTPGLVIASGENGRGGNFVLVLGAKWRMHYFAHLKDIYAKPFTWVNGRKCSI